MFRWFPQNGFCQKKKEQRKKKKQRNKEPDQGIAENDACPLQIGYCLKMAKISALIFHCVEGFSVQASVYWWLQYFLSLS